MDDDRLPTTEDLQAEYDKELAQDESSGEESESDLALKSEEVLKTEELSLTPEQLELRKTEALKLKDRGNEEYKNSNFTESIRTYTEGLNMCPLSCPNERAMLFANRGASRAQLLEPAGAIEDCTEAIKLNDKYVRAYMRRARLLEQTEKLDESLDDYKKLLELDPGNKEALGAITRLPPLIEVRNEKLKGEMLGALKNLGNMILKPFGLSTDNFELKQDPNSGGYSVNFQQNAK